MIGVGVVGLGMASKPHARALQDLADRAEVRGVYARSPAARGAFAAEYGFPEAESLDAIADDPQIKAVLLITPPDARREIVARLAGAGKHILMEKPVERTLAAAEAIVEICEKAGVRLGIVFQHRFRDGARRLAELVNSGALGALHMAQTDIPWWRDQRYYDEPGRGTYARDGGGVLMTQGIHTLDLMLSLTGPAASVQAMTATTGLHQMEAEDYAVAGLTFASGAVGSVVATTAAWPGGAESITLHCERATARLQSSELTLHWRDGRTETFGKPQATGGGADPMAFPYGRHRDLIADFLAAVAENRPPAATGREALRVHRLIEAITASARSGRRETVQGVSE